MRNLFCHVLQSSRSVNCSHKNLFSLVRHASSFLPKKAPSSVVLENRTYPVDSWYNLSERVSTCIGRNLLRKEQHPLFLLKRNIENFFIRKYTTNRGIPVFAFVDHLSPIVSTEQNFDSLLIPPGHPSRTPHDTYYLNENTVFRSHTSAHQVELIKSGLDAFLCFGDCYRRDTVDRTHYPVFHQVEGVRLFSAQALSDMYHLGNKSFPRELFQARDRGEDREPSRQELHTAEAARILEVNLKNTLELLCNHLFGPDIKFRWTEVYFPFTHPSWELEIFWQGYWLEVLGCGIIEQGVLRKSSAENFLGWAFGIGLERIAMALYEIPDIRIFWSEDERFLKQFSGVNPETRITYKTISAHPPVFNDMSFWLPQDREFVENDFFDLVRQACRDLVENVEIHDMYKKDGRTSHCYRFTYRSPTRALTQQEVTKMHEEIRSVAHNQLGVVPRV